MLGGQILLVSGTAGVSDERCRDEGCRHGISVRIGFRMCNSLRTIDMRHYCNPFGRGWSGPVGRPLDVPLTYSAAPA